MPTTDNPNDPRLRRSASGIGMNDAYLVLSDEERAKGFVRPVRHSYIHLACGAATTMGQTIAETYARQPSFYGATYCCHCRAHFPVGAEGEFVWDVDAPPFVTEAEQKTWLATREKVGA